MHAFALMGLARAFGRMAAAQEGEAEAVAHAMHSFPFYVGGPRRPDSELMAAVPGLHATLEMLPEGSETALEALEKTQ